MPSVRKHPGRQRPGPHAARPDGIDAPVDQRGDGEGKGDREADIAEIEQRRMDREAEVLQDRVEILALERRRDRRRANGFEVEQDEQQEGDRDRSPARRARSAADVAGTACARSATSAPNSARMSTQSSIEPSWFPQTPVIL